MFLARVVLILQYELNQVSEQLRLVRPGNQPMTSKHPRCPGISRRSFLSDLGMGFTGLALGAMLQKVNAAHADASAPWAPPDGRPHFTPKAKTVIWFFMVGGTSQMES